MMQRNCTLQLLHQARGSLITPTLSVTLFTLCILISDKLHNSTGIQTHSLLAEDNADQYMS